MMNKALEAIEARWLFDLEAGQVRVVIHPQSIVHSMVVCRDAFALAELGTPDMRVPSPTAWPFRSAWRAAPRTWTSRAWARSPSSRPTSGASRA
jgi:1-deoxy-D-xylulose 5-phosphate reductoisomerase